VAYSAKSRGGQRRLGGKLLLKTRDVSSNNSVRGAEFDHAGSRRGKGGDETSRGIEWGTRLSVTWSVELLTGHLLIRRFDERVVLEVGRQGGEGTEPLSW